MCFDIYGLMQVSWLGRLRTFRLPSLSTSDLNERHSFLTVAGPHRTLTCFPINRRAAGHESDIQFYTGSITQPQAECNPQFEKYKKEGEQLLMVYALLSVRLFIYSIL